MKIKEKAQKYWKEKSWWNKISDFIFIILIIGLLIPSTRMQIIVFVKQISLFSPSAIESNERNAISASDYNWVLEDMEGNQFSMDAYKNKVIFLNEWATWCPPCVAEMPSIQKLYNKVKNNKNVAFIIVTNEKKETVQAFMKKHKFTFPVVLQRSETPKVFQTQSIPVSFLIDKYGKIVIKEFGSKKWNSKSTIKLIEELANE